MKYLLSFTLYLIGVSKIVDWFIFCNQNRELKNDNYSAFIAKYHNHFPSSIEPLFNARPEPAALISVVIFSIAGIIFLKTKSLFYKILAISSFVFAFWNLFSVM